MTDRTYYKSPHYLVTTQRFKARKKGYRITAITRIDVSRIHFFLCLPFLLGLLGMMLFFAELLYAIEIIGITVSISAIGIISWSIGTLNVKGFHNEGLAGIGLYNEMVKIKEAVERAMEASERRSERPRHT